ncbi:MAG: hypothetical protein OXG24_00625 [Gammaproteobacteria bacterium]|nr:hypothetical protein [Gammaproteobacteria bacterium]
MPRFSWINSLQVFLLLSSSLVLLYGSTGLASNVVVTKPTLEEEFQCSDVVLVGKVLRVGEVIDPESLGKRIPSDSENEECTQGGANTLDEFSYSIFKQRILRRAAKVEIEVSESWKGKSTDKITVLTACYPDSCVAPFTVGDAFLVFASTQKVHVDKESVIIVYFWTDWYSANQKLDNSPEAKAVISQLEALKAAAQEDSNDDQGQESRVGDDSPRLE